MTCAAGDKHINTEQDEEQTVSGVSGLGVPSAGFSSAL